MSDQNGSDAWEKGPTFLQAAFQRAEAAQRPLDKQNRVKSPYILDNIQRHKNIPVCAPKGFIRRVPDRQAFMRVEAIDRAKAINRNKSLKRNSAFANAARMRARSSDSSLNL